MSGPAKNQICTLCDKVGLKQFTRENIFNYYIPLHGVVSYAGLAVNCVNPKLVTQIMPKKDITNILLLSSIVGTAFYINGRAHLAALPAAQRATYAALGGTLFSMGSVLLWAVLKSALPVKNSAITTIAAVGTGALIVKLSIDYFNALDRIVVKSN